MTNGIQAEKDKILLLGDRRSGLRKLQRVFGADYELLLLENRDYFTRIVDTNRPGCIVLDCSRFDRGLLGLIRKNRAVIGRIPLIVITSSRTRRHKIEALECGVSDYFIKPVDDDELLLKIRNHLAIKRSRDMSDSRLENISNINNMTGKLIKELDQQNFSFNNSLEILIGNYIRQSGDKGEIPSFVMTAFRESSGNTRSILYRIGSSEIPVAIRNFSVRNFRSLLLDEGDDDVSYAAFDPGRADFGRNQKKFHQELKKGTGDIVNYVSYSGQRACLFAFNFPRNPDRFMAWTLKELAIQVNFFKLMDEKIEDVKNAFIYSMNSLTRAVDLRDELTGAHAVRIQYLSMMVARKMGLPEKFTRDIYNSAQLHDIGKIQIPIDILNKSGKLDGREWAVMKQHTVHGARIIGNSEHLKVARNICLYHHENFDGTGYPYGLKGNEIPIEARIVRLVDVYDSLRSRRPYKPRYSHEKSLSIMSKGDQRVNLSHFDPEILKIFYANHRQFGNIFDSFSKAGEKSRRIISRAEAARLPRPGSAAAKSPPPRYE